LDGDAVVLVFIAAATAIFQEASFAAVRSSGSDFFRIPR
jgi:hypothetical protein